MAISNIINESFAIKNYAINYNKRKKGGSINLPK